MVYVNGETDLGIKDIIIIIWNMGKGNIYVLRENSFKGNGKTVLGMVVGC